MQVAKELVQLAGYDLLEEGELVRIGAKGKDALVLSPYSSRNSDSHSKYSALEPSEKLVIKPRKGVFTS